MQNSCGIVISHSDRIYDESSRESLPSFGPSLKQHKTGQGSIGRLRLGLLCSCGLAKGGLRLLMAVGVAAFAGTTKNQTMTLLSNPISHSPIWICSLKWKHFEESSKFHDWPVKMSRFNGNWLVLLKWQEQLSGFACKEAYKRYSNKLLADTSAGVRPSRVRSVKDAPFLSWVQWTERHN